MKYSTVSIVIPVYNEEKFIGTTLETVVSSDTLGLTKEIVVVDDGSTDKTIDVLKQKIEKLKNKNNNNCDIKLILNTTNKGKGSALKDGFRINLISQLLLF